MQKGTQQGEKHKIMKRAREEDKSPSLIASQDITSKLSPKALCAIESFLETIIKALTANCIEANIFNRIVSGDIVVRDVSLIKSEEPSAKKNVIGDSSEEQYGNEEIRTAVVDAWCAVAAKQNQNVDLSAQQQFLDSVEKDPSCGSISLSAVNKIMEALLDEDDQKFQIVALYEKAFCLYVLDSIEKGLKKQANNNVSSSQLQRMVIFDSDLPHWLTSKIRESIDALLDFTEDLVESVDYSRYVNYGFTYRGSIELNPSFHYSGQAGKQFSDACREHSQFMEPVLEKVHSKYPAHVKIQSSRLGLDLLVEVNKIEEKDKQFLQEMTQLINSSYQHDTSFFVTLRQEHEKEVNSAYIEFKNKTDSMFQSCQKNNYWSNLSSDNFLTNEQMLLEVLSFMDIPTLLQASTVCKEWFRLVCCPPGSAHKPLITELYLKDLVRENGMHEQKSFVPLLSRFSHNLTLLNCSWCIYITQDDLNFLPVFCNKLKHLNLEHVSLNDQAIEKIAKANQEIEELYLENCFAENPGPFFKYCKNLREIQVTTDECDISIDKIGDEELKILADNTNGNIEHLDFSKCCSEVTDAGMAYLVSKCPNLHTFLFVYEMYNLEALDSPPQNSKTVDALVNLNKKLSFVSMNHISTADIARVERIARRTEFRDNE